MVIHDKIIKHGGRLILAGVNNFCEPIRKFYFLGPLVEDLPSYIKYTMHVLQ